MTTPNDPSANPPQSPGAQPAAGQQPGTQPPAGPPAQPAPAYVHPGYGPGEYPPAPEHDASSDGAPAAGPGQPTAYPHPGLGMTPFGDPASMASRLAARVIDGLIVAVPFGIAATIAGLAGGFDTLVYVIGAAGVVAFVIYESCFVGITGATPGKRSMNAKVIDATTGGPIGVGRAFVRYVVLVITGGIFTIGYWSPFFDGSKRKQGWHDKVGKDFVVATVAEPQATRR